MSADKKWKKEIIGVSNGQFTKDNKSVICMLPGDSLAVSQLGSMRCKYFPQVFAYQFITRQKTEWLVMQMTGETKALRLLEWNGSKSKTFTNVSDYRISKNGESLLLKKEDSSGGQVISSVEWIGLEKDDVRTIWESGASKLTSPRIENLSFDEQGKQAVFMVSGQTNNKAEQDILYYKQGMPKAVEKVTSKRADLPDNAELSGAKFSRDGSRIFLEGNIHPAYPPRESAAKVDVWSYKDDKLQSQQLKESSELKSFYLAYNLQNSQIATIRSGDEELYYDPFSRDDYALVIARPGVTIKRSIGEPLVRFHSTS
jgi:hypothetical protein